MNVLNSQIKVCKINNKKMSWCDSGTLKFIRVEWSDPVRWVMRGSIRGEGGGQRWPDPPKQIQTY